MKKQKFSIDQQSARVSYWHECPTSSSFDMNTYTHLNLFKGVIRLMKKRGWAVGIDPLYKERNKCLSKYHKYGRKGDLEVKMEIFANGFRLEFFQNIVFKNSNGGYYDFDKFDKMPYLIKVRFKVIANAIKAYLFKKGIPDETEPSNPSAVDKILKDQKINTHIHGGATTLAEIGDYVEKDKAYYKEKGWQPNRNYLDANKQDLKCGQTKYFYSYQHSNRFVRGIIYHNINNMWWVIYNGVRCNVAAFDLMDFCPFLVGRKRLSPKAKIAKLKRKRSELEAVHDYKKCISVQAKIDKLVA